MARRILAAVVAVLVFAVSCPWVYAECGPPLLKDYVGPGKHETDLLIKPNNVGNHDPICAGKVTMWNTRDQFIINILPDENWKVTEYRIYAGSDPVPVSGNGAPKTGTFPYKKHFPHPAGVDEVPALELDLVDDLNFTWGQRDKGQRIQNVAVYVKLVGQDGHGNWVAHKEAWADGPKQFETQWGTYLRYRLDHPRTGHFVDAPVGGAGYKTDTGKGRTDSQGAFDYIPGEEVTLSVGSLCLGTAVAEHKITPMELVGTDNIKDPRVVNMARILQSLDADRDPTRGIRITDQGIGCLEQAMNDLAITEVDFSDSALVESLIAKTVSLSGGTLEAVSAEEALENLEKGTASNVFRKNVSKTPDMETAKAKIEIMPVYVPAQKANGDPVKLRYIDADGTVTERTHAKPLVVIYADEVPETGGAQDVFAAVSRDDGATWKRTNLSRSAARSSFTLENGFEYPGDVHKPQVKVQGNKILVAWTSKYARTGKPTYAIKTDDEYPYDDPYWEDDIWGVSGPQRSVDYTEQGYLEVGELPFSVVWACRGIIDEETGEITWFKAERLTSGRRDACQVMMNAANNAGFAIVWQEDPEGLRPGQMCGPGEGWSGATVNHKTDVWYSYVKWDDFGIIDENYATKGEPQHDEDEDVTGRPKALVPFTLPVRISDNDILNTENMKLEKDETGKWVPDPDAEKEGTHRYGYILTELFDGTDERLYNMTNHQGVSKNVVITADGRLMDGDTGAARPNIMMQPYQKPDGTYSAWVMICYEESKGVGSGPPGETTTESTDVSILAAEASPEKGTGKDSGSQKGQGRYFPDLGKNVIYHSFDLEKPDLVSAGKIINPKATDENGEPLYLTDEEGNFLVDYLGNRIPAYENARRPRMIVQSKKNALGNGTEGTVMVIVFKMGEEGQGRQSDIFMRRWVVKKTDTGNPYAVKYLTSDIQNISSVTPTETWTNTTSQSQSDPTSDGQGHKREPIKVVRWEQTEANLTDRSSTNPHDDARAHRGFIKGNFLAIAYDWTPNWAAARNGNDIYNLFIRRSFDGGATWTTDPNGSGVTHTQTFKVYEGKESGTGEGTDRYTVTTFYPAGEFEPARNMSQLMSTKVSVIEPRLVGVPGTITSTWSNPEDTQDAKSFWVTYGTEVNVGKHDEDQEGGPLDLYYSYSTDYGETYYTLEKQISPDSSGKNAGEIVTVWDWLAKDTGKSAAAQAECQIRMTPDGSILFTVWNETGDEGSDVIFRRILRDGGTIEVVPLETGTAPADPGNGKDPATPTDPGGGTIADPSTGGNGVGNSSAVPADGEIRIILNDVELCGDVAPFIDSQNRTQVPIRIISENLGADVVWNKGTRTVTITAGNKVIVLAVGSKSFSINGQANTMDTAPQIKSGRTFVPLRFVAEALGANVDWDGATGTVTIGTR